MASEALRALLHDLRSVRGPDGHFGLEERRDRLVDTTQGVDSVQSARHVQPDYAGWVGIARELAQFG